MEVRPSRDVRRESFLKTFEGDVAPKKSNIGQLVFQKEDILKTNHMLSRLLRGIFYVNKITIPYLTQKYKEYALNVLNEMPSRISTGRGNLISAITRDKVSINKFYEVLNCILGYDIDLTVLLKDPDGVAMDLNYNKLVEDVINNTGDFADEE
jgi:hypothetical protein